MESILEAIGNTPLIRVHRCAPENGAELWLKLQLRNPSGSLKDRMALAMIEGAERDGLISPGDTVVEYTGGTDCFTEATHAADASARRGDRADSGRRDERRAASHPPAKC
jgi:cysteine synthase